ncbi:hypothetical protein GCM10010451_12600 [Streptomyces virens]|uniref:Tn3 transposase DDE domain-containing protein n=1 Tax=Streptomyces virens TaxID=285572 RepID=A0ABP6P2X4_9ACTN
MVSRPGLTFGYLMEFFRDVPPDLKRTLNSIDVTGTGALFSREEIRGSPRRRDAINALSRAAVGLRQVEAQCPGRPFRRRL